jgi:hypothetical protein
MEAYEIEREVARELSGGEKLLWSGQPRQGLILRPSDAFVIPFSLLWCGFAIVWETFALTGDKAPWFFKLWGLPFVAAGLYMVFGRFIADAAERKNTVYAVTNERILIIGGLFSRAVKSLSLRTLQEISFSERRDGTGTIVLGPTTTFTSGGWSRQQRQSSPPELVGIPDARTVYDLIRQAQKGGDR